MDILGITERISDKLIQETCSVLERTSLKVKGKGQRSNKVTGDKKRHFRPFQRPACGLYLVKHL